MHCQLLSVCCPATQTTLLRTLLDTILVLGRELLHTAATTAGVHTTPDAAGDITTTKSFTMTVGDDQSDAHRMIPTTNTPPTPDATHHGHAPSAVTNPTILIAHMSRILTATPTWGDVSYSHGTPTTHQYTQLLTLVGPEGGLLSVDADAWVALTDVLTAMVDHMDDGQRMGETLLAFAMWCAAQQQHPVAQQRALAWATTTPPIQWLVWSQPDAAAVCPGEHVSGEHVSGNPIQVVYGVCLRLICCVMQQPANAEIHASACEAAVTVLMRAHGDGEGGALGEGVVGTGVDTAVWVVLMQQVGTSLCVRVGVRVGVRV